MGTYTRNIPILAATLSLLACGSTAPIGGSGGTGGNDDAGSTGSPELVWPNAESSANSDPWLVEHHDQITQLRPRVLLIDLNPNVSLAQTREFSEKLITALAEGSRYHGYSDVNARPFLSYSIVKAVEISGPVPTKGGSFDYNEYVNGQAFADRIGFKDPSGSNNLTLCQLFERGLINEVWIGQDESGSVPVIYEIKAQGQVYDKDLNKILGKFEPCSGNGCMDAVSCGVSIRLATVNPNRGPGCGTHAYGHAIEGQVLRNQIPYFADNARRFFNLGMKAQYGTSFDDLYGCPYAANSDNPCVEFSSPTHITSGPAMPSSFDIDDWGAGCGNVHFAPHSRFHYDYENSSAGVTSRATCEGYGLGQGPGGADTAQDIDYDVYKALNQDPAYSDCGGGWQIYMRQSMPGYQNRAKGVDGKPMKNWWPFLFY